MLQLLGLKVIKIPNSSTEGLHLDTLRQARKPIKLPVALRSAI
jgi:hypothetical protein